MCLCQEVWKGTNEKQAKEKSPTLWGEEFNVTEEGKREDRRLRKDMGRFY